MKKIVYLLAALIPAIAFTSCDDNDDVPDVSFNVQFAQNQYSNGEVYVAQGDTLVVESVEVTNNEQGKGVTIPYVNYYFDYQFLGQNPVQPYRFKIAIPEDMQLGKYQLELTAPVYAVDKAPGYALVPFTVNVVSSTQDIPSDAVQTAMTVAKVTQQE